VPNALAGLASLLWGTADFLGGFAASRWRAERVALVSQTIGLVLIGALAPVLTGPVAPAEDLLWGAGAGASGAFGAVLLYRALSIGPMNAAAPTIAVVTAIVPALVGFAQGERPTTLALSGVGVGVVAVAMIGGASAPGPGAPRATPRVLAMSVLSGIGLGLANACFAQTAEASGLWPVVATKVVAFVLIGSFVLVTARATAGVRATPRNVRFAIATGFVDASATASVGIALQRGSLVLVSILASLFPGVTVVLARIFLGERIGRAQAVGIALALLAVAAVVAG
jgi:drug/metabolite transporter (DMT)-like permease